MRYRLHEANRAAWDILDPFWTPFKGYKRGITDRRDTTAIRDRRDRRNRRDSRVKRVIIRNIRDVSSSGQHKDDFGVARRLRAGVSAQQY